MVLHEQKKDDMAGCYYIIKKKNVIVCMLSLNRKLEAFEKEHIWELLQYEVRPSPPTYGSMAEVTY